MHAPILSQSQLDQLDQPIMGCNPETSETPEWHSLWWCIRNVPGDVCRYLCFMRFSLLLLYRTNPVIEFLRTAKDALPHDRVLPVLLIEIRNSDDIDDTDSPDSYANQANLVFQPYAPNEAHQPGSPKDGAWKAPRTSPGRWGPVAEVLAPPEPAIHAGFNSTTRRNRRELGLLECAFDPQLSIEHLVFDHHQQIALEKGHQPHTKDPQIDTAESEVDQPLSWHLTKRQQQWISGNLDPQRPPSRTGKR